jgi:hypothetical protein
VDKHGVSQPLHKANSQQDVAAPADADVME